MATCEWVIDIIQEWADARFLQPPIFVDRGDPAAPDYDKTDFTADAAWHELDLSAIVPEGATAVLFRSRVRVNTIGQLFRIREHGNANTTNISTIITQVANLDYYSDLICQVDANRKIDYNASNIVWFFIFFTVAGWWL